MVLFSKKIVLLGLLIWKASTGFCQTVELTLQEADSLFLARNIDLLAEKCNISMADAAITQAKLYQNPVISLEENVYNRLSHRYFDFGRESEQQVNVDQLISIAGQHSNVVKEARSGHDVAVARFEELLRNLRAELHQTFVKLYFAQRNMKIYQNEIVSLRTTLDQLIAQEKKGNISRIETARIQALLLSVRREQNEFLENVSSLQGRLRLLMAMPSSMNLTAVFNPDPAVLPDVSECDRLLTDSLMQRSDVLMALHQTEQAKAALKVSKSQAWPEVHITGQYDRNAGYFPNYFAVGVSLSVPIFNHNQGHIRSAKARIVQCEQNYTGTLEKAQNEVVVAKENFLRSLSLEKSVSDNFDKENIQNLFQSVNENYRKRNISLLEFVDFYKTYKEAMLEVSTVREKVYLTAEELNKAAGREVVKY
ncbi:TolC family protein [Bacteroides mediterraneensis]|uniref:TolC family protein n=1 Tax=Bacteroides mediterraneensis TaxID=1841856 RepID=A0ABS2EVH3_9BACE|nr:TolC family protein [Bacteroides mediterraneensis]MBM6758559.1 TolC family protein [Bacteroides mediterraneensis]